MNGYQSILTDRFVCLVSGASRPWAASNDSGAELSFDFILTPFLFIETLAIRTGHFNPYSQPVSLYGSKPRQASSTVRIESIPTPDCGQDW